MAKTNSKVCAGCTIEETFMALAEQPVETHVAAVLKMWRETYAEDLRTVAALFHATTETAQRWADEQPTPTKKKVIKLKVAA